MKKNVDNIGDTDTGNSSSKLKGILVVALLAATGFLGYQLYESREMKKNGKAAFPITPDVAQDISSEPKLEPDLPVSLKLDPELAAQNAKIQKELIEEISEVKTLVSQKQYTTALSKIAELDLDTTLLKDELAGLVEDEREYKKKQAELKSKLAKRESELKEKRKQELVDAEKNAAQAKIIWEEETAAARSKLQQANTQKEKSLSFIATNQPQVEVIRNSNEGDAWEAKVVLKRPDNKPKTITLKLNKNKLLQSNSAAIVKVLGPHIEKVNGKKQLNWELVVKDAQLEKQLSECTQLVNEQKKILFLKEQSIRKKYPKLSEYFPQ